MTGRNCQTSDWKSQKGPCAAAPKWYDKHRLCRDGNSHEGRLELITWDCPEEGKGWGAYFADESESLKRKFEIEFESNEENLKFNIGQCGTRLLALGTTSTSTATMTAATTRTTP
jgi:hypothetical protein